MEQDFCKNLCSKEDTVALAGSIRIYGRNLSHYEQPFFCFLTNVISSSLNKICS